jgi:lipopolysaccharide transport system ATP-binding protein
MTAAIQVSGLGKQYRIGLQRQRYKTLRETLAGWLDRKAAAEKKMIWALHDVGFEVQQGESIGVIGRNGAGKSTLLKILSRITEPTLGRIELSGRVGSLLEVGTGFHPELTGRENISLNGAILGMKRAEIRARFDDIVEFAGVGQFLDTPVKRYSSGMYIRLAFAVAAHLEPEILLVDEVLAVGDFAFQSKCLGKMGDVARSGRTVLFVSHNMAAIEALCPRTILLEHGRVIADGPSAEVIQKYMGSAGEAAGDFDLTAHPSRAPGAPAVLRRLRFLDEQGQPVNHLPLGRTVQLVIEGVAERAIGGAQMILQINNPIGQRITTLRNDYQDNRPLTLQGPFHLTCRFQNIRLMPGPYQMLLILKGQQGMADQLGPLSFDVAPRDIYGTGKILPTRSGPYLAEAQWSV